MSNTYDSQTGLLQQNIDALNNKVTYIYDTQARDEHSPVRVGDTVLAAGFAGFLCGAD